MIAARMAARSGAEVLITGAPGAGTSKVAEVIHLMSAAAQRPFVKLAAAGLTPDGLEAGFARAEEGTLYLDEVTSLPQPAQFALLELLMRRQGEVLPRSLIASQVWDMNFDSDTNVVDVAIRRLRAKVDDPYQLKLIHTVRGMGYMLEAQS
mgnify:CR=1 FL=1